MMSERTGTSRTGTGYSKTNAWNISFKLNQVPKGIAVLTFGIAAALGRRSQSAHGTANLQVWVNNKETGGFSAESTGGVSYRSARQSTRYSVKEIHFDTGLLREGQNVISLRHTLSEPYMHGEKKGESGSGPGCIMYDAIRLEIA